MFSLPQGTNLGKILAYLLTLPTNLKRLAYCEEYCINIHILCNYLNTFLKNSNLKFLLENDFIIEFLKTEKIVISSSSAPWKIMDEVTYVLDVLICLEFSLQQLIKKYKFLIRNNYEDGFAAEEIDDRIVFNRPMEYLKKNI